MHGQYRSSVPHSWRTTWAAISLLVLVAVLEHWLTTGPLVWLLRALGPFQWSFGPVGA